MLQNKVPRIAVAAAALWLSAVAPLPAAQADAASNRVEQVVVVFKTHFDIGYTDMASNIVQKYRTTMIGQALKVVDQNRGLPPEQQFVWTIPGWPMKKILEDWPGQTPERKQRVLDAFDQGRFVVHALPFTTHTELLEPEDLVRGMRFSSDLSRANGKPLPRDAKMTDVPSHSWILPTLLRHAGVDFLHLGCNAASSSPQVPRLFWWEGPDSSRLLTMYTAESYGTGLVPPRDWPHRTWLALIHTGDNHGPPTPEEVRDLLQEAKQKLPGVKIRIGRLSDFADAILAEKSEIPVVRGDMPDTWIYGPMANPDGMALARNLRPAIAATDFLATELHAWRASAPDTTATLAAAYEKSLLYSEHTWGGAFWWIYGKYILKFGEEWEQERAAGKFQRIESSWDEHTAYIQSARDLIRPALEGELHSLAQAVKVSGRRIVVFNPLPWSRSGMVAAVVKGPLGPLTEVGTGRRIPIERTGDNGLRFLAREVPAGGYKTFTLPDSPKPERPPATPFPASHVIENKFFRVTLDPARGTVQSLIDRRSGRELVDASAPQGFGQYLYERFDKDQVQSFVKAYVKIDAEWGINELGKPSLPPASAVPHRATSPSDFKVRLEESPVALTAVMEAPAGSSQVQGVTTRVVLYRDQPYLDLEVTVHNKPFDAWPEAGWICLPFKVDAPQFRLGRLGSIVDPARDIVAGCNFHQFALNTGMTVTDSSGRGIGICPLDSPLVSLGEPGCWKYSKTFTPRKSRVFVNLFNNQWSTNFRLWNAGTWTSRVRLWPVTGGDAEKNLVTPSEEARCLLLAGVADGPAGEMAPAQRGLELSRCGVLVTAFGDNPDGPGQVLRLWEYAGQSGKCTVRLPALMEIDAIQPVDLRGQPQGAPIPVRRGSFSARLQAFAPASFQLQSPQTR